MIEYDRAPTAACFHRLFTVSVLLPFARQEVVITRCGELNRSATSHQPLKEELK